LKIAPNSPADTLSSSEIAVRCRGITKTYGSGESRVEALRGVDLDVYSGELLMLVGPSGCGKTTLISIIAAILDPDAGSCAVLGNDVVHMNATQRAHFRARSIGFVFQIFNLLPALTASENVAIPLLINGASLDLAKQKAGETLESVGLGDRKSALPGELSGGQQQRVAIARALVHDPALIVCDEPTSSLDHQTGRRMMAVLRDIARSPERALIVVTHDNRIFDFADRTAHMDDGRIVDNSTVSRPLNDRDKP